MILFQAISKHRWDEAFAWIDRLRDLPFSQCSCFLGWFMRSSFFGKTFSFLCFRIIWQCRTEFSSSLLVLFCLNICGQVCILSSSGISDFITSLARLSPLLGFFITEEIWLKHLLELILTEHPCFHPLLRLILAEIFCLKEKRNSPPWLVVIFFNAFRFWCLEFKVFLIFWVRHLVDSCDIGILLYLTTMVLSDFIV